jgi:hypothetical protein
VRNIDPDGTRRDVRPETGCLSTTVASTRSRRLRMYLKQAPGTPFYGLFRASALGTAVAALDGAADERQPIALGLDMIVLAKVFAAHEVAVTHEPLLLFRRGGHSHRIDAYGTLRQYLGEVWRFGRAMSKVVASKAFDPRLRMVLVNYLARFVFSAPMLRMTWHYFSRSWPALDRLRSYWLMHWTPAFVRLRTRARALAPGSQVVIFGAGKHTQRMLRAIRLALGSQTRIIGVCDDAAIDGGCLHDVPIISPDDLAALRPDLILVSSDTYESLLASRAAQVAPMQAAIWCIYDMANERAASASRDSIEARNRSMTSMLSSSFSVADRAGESEPRFDLIESTN